MIDVPVLVIVGRELIRLTGASVSGLIFTCVFESCMLYTKCHALSHKYLRADTDLHKTRSCSNIAVDENVMNRSCVCVKKCMLCLIPAVRQVFGGEDMR
jgi:hypothetical protein